MFSETRIRVSYVLFSSSNIPAVANDPATTDRPVIRLDNIGSTFVPVRPTHTSSNAVFHAAVRAHIADEAIGGVQTTAHMEVRH